MLAMVVDVTAYVPAERRMVSAVPLIAASSSANVLTVTLVISGGGWR